MIGLCETVRLPCSLSRKGNGILLDDMITQINGIEVLRRLRMEDEHTPVILLIARDTVSNKVMGLDQGTNDYITKLFGGC
jgi:two-component system, OmpR family, response regulator